MTVDSEENQRRLMMVAPFSLLGVRIPEYAMCPEVLWLLTPPLPRGSEARGLRTLALETGHRGLIHSSANLTGWAILKQFVPHPSQL